VVLTEGLPATFVIALLAQLHLLADVPAAAVAKVAAVVAVAVVAVAVVAVAVVAVAVVAVANLEDNLHNLILILQLP